MPRYFFHIHDGEQQGFDSNGLELQNSAEAHSEAVTTVGELLKDIDGDFTAGKWHVRVVDDAGETVSEIRVSVDKKSNL